VAALAVAAWPGVTAAGPAGAASPVTVSIGDAAIVEGHAGTRTLNVPVVLSDPVAGDITVSYAVSGGTATAGVDFQLASPGTLPIPAGALVGRLAVRVAGDTLVEGTETVSITLTGVSPGVSIARATGVARILDDDLSVGLRIGVGNVTVTEGDTGTPREIRVPISLSAPSASRVTMRYAVTGVSAAPGVDYTAPASGTATIAAGTLTVGVPVRILPDVSPEGTEVVRVTISQPSAGVTIARATGTLSILDDDRALHAWGNNGSGRLGDGTTAQRLVPVRAGADADWVQVTAGDFHSCGLRAPGRLFCWGGNESGQLGDGTTAPRPVPTRVGTANTWTQVSAGVAHTCAVRSPGTLWCWGANEVGQLGDGTTTARLTPVQVGGATDWAQVAAGRGHTCALRRTGALFCWGANDWGQLGDGTSTNRLTPTRIGTLVDWSQITAGRNHTCGIRRPGTLWCWGANGSGQLGDGSTRGRSNPVLAGPLVVDWSQVAPGRNHTCGIRRPGTLWCWGANGSGQIGDDTTHNRRTPFQVTTATNWVRAAGGGSHTCAVRSPGALWCWGANSYGQLGDGTVTRRLTPVRVGTATTWADVAAGRTHSLGVKRP
jgi:alpha-tubulin suppressor-like RCC1 family protein